MTDNERRVANGLKALNSHPTTLDGEDRRTVLIDLLADLHHLAGSEGWDWDACVLIADIHYRSEVGDVARDE